MTAHPPPSSAPYAQQPVPTPTSTPPNSYQRNLSQLRRLAKAESIMILVLIAWDLATKLAYFSVNAAGVRNEDFTGVSLITVGITINAVAQAALALAALVVLIMIIVKAAGPLRTTSLLIAGSFVLLPMLAAPIVIASAFLDSIGGGSPATALVWEVIPIVLRLAIDVLLVVLTIRMYRQAQQLPQGS